MPWVSTAPVDLGRVPSTIGQVANGRAPAYEPVRAEAIASGGAQLPVLRADAPVAHGALEEQADRRHLEGLRDVVISAPSAAHG